MKNLSIQWSRLQSPKSNYFATTDLRSNGGFSYTHNTIREQLAQEVKISSRLTWISLYVLTMTMSVVGILGMGL